MSVNATKVLTGAPDQLTTGPILSAPRGTALPASITATIDPAFKDSGYVSEDGLTLTPERSTEQVRDWSGSVVRELLTEFAAKLAWSHLETNEQSLKNYMGDDNVTVTAATATEGRRITALLRSSELPRKPWVFKMKDGDARVLIVVPDGQVSETGEVSFVKSSAVTWPVTLTTYPDASGVNVYIYFDDGTVLVAGVPVISSVTGQPEPATTGQMVTIKGTRFTGVTNVTIGGTAATDWTVIDAETIVATMPAGTAGPVPVVVTNNVGPSAAFTYTRGGA